MTPYDYAEDVVTSRAIECILRVHHTLGPGFVEHVYRRALTIELARQGLFTEAEKSVLIYYDGHVVGRHRLDLLVEAQLILELKAVEALSRAHYAQVRSYLKATKLQVALLVNFSGARVDFRRVQALPAPRVPTAPRVPLDDPE